MRVFTLILLTTTLAACAPTTKNFVIGKEVFQEMHHKRNLNYQEHPNFFVVTSRSPEEESSLKAAIEEGSHHIHRCGGFTEEEPEELKLLIKNSKELSKIRRKFKAISTKRDRGEEGLLKESLDSLSKEGLLETVKFLSNFPTRSARSEDPNKSIYAFEEYIHKTLKNFKGQYSLKRFAHNKTSQDSLHLSLKAENPEEEEIIILGAHIDSTTNSFWSKEAPGADDNASGSAALLEALKVFLGKGYKPKKNIEFFWYAAEEQGLVGSKEIAQTYKEQNKKVMAVLQLDMILYPGNGDVIGLTADNTDANLTEHMEGLIKDQLGLATERYKCGYGCSDHASWHRYGFSTFYPFEATFRTYNRKIHTKNDLIGPHTDFNHALNFAKIAFLFMADLSGSTVSSEVEPAEDRKLAFDPLQQMYK